MLTILLIYLALRYKRFLLTIAFLLNIRYNAGSVSSMANGEAIQVLVKKSYLS